MKVKKLFSTAIVLTASIFATAAINASEVSDKFDALLPNFGVEDFQVRAKAQEEWQAFCLKISNDPAKRAEAVTLMKENLARGENAETVLAFLPVLGLIGEPKDLSAISTFLNKNATFVDSVFAKEGRVLIEDEAVRALARIPGRESTRALSSSNSIYARSGLIAHTKRQKVKVGVENQMPMAIPYASQRTVDQYLRKFASQSDVVKTQIIIGLGIRGDAKYAKLIKESIKSENNQLRQAAITASAKIGTDDVIETLVELLFGGDDSSVRAAGLALSICVNKQVDTKLLEIAKTETDEKRFNLVSDILVNRKTAAFLPLLLTRLKANTTPNRKTSISRAASIATAENLSDFIDLWLVLSDRGDRNEVEKVIARFANGDATAVIAKQTPENKENMYSLLGRIGDPKMLPEFRKALAATSAEALSAVAEWPDAAVAKDLLEIVQGKLGEYSANDKVRALRSYIRVISLPTEKLGIKATVEEQADFLVAAFELATQDEERNLVIRRLGAVRHVKSLNFAVGQVDNEKLSGSAIATILDLAHHAQLRRQDADTFKAALELVTKKSKDKGQIDRANGYLSNF